ncbi:MAG: thioredoxin domain-containing protein [Myxococcota bacterium]
MCRVFVVVSVAAALNCAGPNHEAMEELRAEHAQTRESLQAMRSELAALKQSVDQIAEREPVPAVEPVAEPRTGPDPESIYAFELDDAPVKGKADAWITVIEISDFQCPFCSRVQPTLAAIRERYGDEVRFVFKHNPLSFHQYALPAANAAECAREQNRFWAMHDVLFENQQALQDEDLAAYAKKLQLNMKKWRQCFAEKRYEDKILTDQRRATTLGAMGTPTFYVNGRFLAGAQPMPAFVDLIDQELEKAKESGMSRGEYYEKAVIGQGKREL